MYRVSFHMSMGIAFQMRVGADDAGSLVREIEASLIAAKMDPANLVRVEAVPAGTFGFSEPILKFLGEAWAEFVKVPRAVHAVAKGIEGYLKNRPNANITLEQSDGTKIRISANMSGADIATLLSNQRKV